MNRIHHISRLVRVLAGFVGALVAVGIAAPAAFARVLPPPQQEGRYAPAPVVPAQHSTPVPTHVQTAVAIGMPGWQIALIAVGAAILAAILAVLLYRAWSARHLQPTTAA